MPMMVCVECQLFMKVKKNGVTWEEGMPRGDSDDGSGWGPYKLWKGDLYKCQSCGNEIIAGMGQGPIAEHYEPGYERAKLIHAPVLMRVDDCPGAYIERKQ